MKGLLGVIADYDARREARIAELEEALQAERKKTDELTTLLMNATQANERKQLELILAGHFDKKEPA